MFSPVNPKAAAIFRLLTGKAGITGEYLPGGVLINPLPLAATQQAITEAILAASNARKEITAPLPPPGTEDAPSASYEATKGLPLPLPGKEREFASLTGLIASLEANYTAVVNFSRHTDRVVNNLIDLCGLAAAYTASIRKLGLGVAVNQRTSPHLSTVPNISEADNIVNLGGVSGSFLGQERAFPQLTTPEMMMELSSIPPALSDLPDPLQYGTGYGNMTAVADAVSVDDYRMITALTEVLDQTGIPKSILPDTALLADINQAAHGETLFSSILPERFGGDGIVILEKIRQTCQLVGMDLSSPAVVDQAITDMTVSSSSLANLIKRDIAQWGEEALRPPSFPSGLVLQTIYCVSRCEAVYNLSMDENLQGILLTCVSPITLQILRT